VSSLLGTGGDAGEHPLEDILLLLMGLLVVVDPCLLLHEVSRSVLVYDFRDGVVELVADWKPCNFEFIRQSCSSFDLQCLDEVLFE
jgi:hypothetical protein